MPKPILYLDCDGVIFNTIQEGYNMMQEINMDIHNRAHANFFFQTVDWNVLIYRAGILKNSILKIKNIINSNEYRDVIIVTKLSGNEYEEKIKRIILGKLLPNTKVITLKINENKDEVVDSINNILVDDDINNTLRFRKKGIGLHFVSHNPNYELDEIDDLDNIQETASVKRLLKTRNI